MADRLKYRRALDRIASGIKRTVEQNEDPRVQLAKDIAWARPSWTELNRRGVTVKMFRAYVRLAREAGAIPQAGRKRTTFNRTCDSLLENPPEDTKLDTPAAATAR